MHDHCRSRATGAETMTVEAGSIRLMEIGFAAVIYGRFEIGLLDFLCGRPMCTTIINGSLSDTHRT